MSWCSGKSGLLRFIALEHRDDVLTFWNDLTSAHVLRTAVIDDTGERLPHRFEVGGLDETPVQPNLKECGAEASAALPEGSEAAASSVSSQSNIEYFQRGGFVGVPAWHRGRGQ